MSRLMPSMHVMRWVLAIIAVVVAWIVGSHYGALLEGDRMVADLSVRQSEFARLEKDYQSQIAQLRTQRDVANATNERLQESLQQLRTESLEQKSSLRLYERIEGTDVSSGLGVDTIAVVNDTQGLPIELHITLVQARGRNRVKGRIGVALVGERAGKNAREVIAAADSDAALPFDMRFFQTIVVSIPATDILADLVEVDVRPEGKLHKPFSYELDWASILEN